MSDFLAQGVDRRAGPVRALAIEPLFDRAYLALGRLLLDQGRGEEALRYLRHGAEHAAEPSAIVEALARAEAELTAPPAGP